MDFFETNGVPLKTERGGRVFPQSDKSTDIIDMEGTSILQVANKYKAKVSIIKFVSDNTTNKNNQKQ